jgi:hypothetical protein
MPSGRSENERSISDEDLVRLTLALAASVTFQASSVVAFSDDNDCGLSATGRVDAGEVPEGTDVVACDLIGRPLDLGEAVIGIPEPGESVRLTVDGVNDEGISAEITTGADGEVSYEVADVESPANSAAAAAAVASPAVNGCDDTYAGATKYKYLRSTWKFYIGDGGLPAAGTAAQLASAIESAGATWSTENSPCFPNDRSRAPDVNYAGRTTTEADISVSGGDNICTDRDGTSTIDAGNLANDTDAANCAWANEDSGTVLESDIRFNTTDQDFTYTPAASSCNNDYDVLSVLTHEIGHTYGMKDKEAASSVYQTMYFQSFTCRTFARGLGRSDVVHLRGQYPW